MFLLLLFPSQRGIWVQGEERCPHGMRGNEHPIPVTLSGRACLCTQASDLIVEVAVSCVLVSEHEQFRPIALEVPTRPHISAEQLSRSM